MAVEVDVELKCPLQPRRLETDVSELLKHWLDLEEEPRVESRIQEDADNPALLANYACIRLRVDEDAEVDISPYVDPSGPKVKVCISYAPLRSVESKILCLVIAVAIAKAGDVKIEDESGIFGSGRSIDPHTVLGRFKVRRGEPTFRARSKEVARLMFGGKE